MNMSSFRKQPLSEDEKAKIIQMFAVSKLSLRQIAPLFHVSATWVSRVLRANGIDTSKAVACHITKPCAFCEQPTTKTRAQGRHRRRFFCSRECYKDWLQARSSYEESRQGSRIGRATAELFYGALPEGSILHHADGKQYNNHPHNLILFGSTRDHLRWHRGFRDLVTPLWIGADVPESEVQERWYNRGVLT